MNPPSVDIKDLLEDESALGLVFSSNLFIGREPTKPNDCVTIFDTPGSPPDTMYSQDETKYNRPSVQIRVRSNNYTDGWDLANDIKEVLHNHAQEYIGTSLYTAILCSAEPAFLDWDSNSRVRFVTTFNLQRR